MLNQKLIDHLFEDARHRGADFVEIFIEETHGEKLTWLDGALKEASGGIDYGIGLRLIQNGQVFYAHTSDDSEKGMRDCLAHATSWLSAKDQGQNADMPATASRVVDMTPLGFERPFARIDLGRKVDLLRCADQAARRTHSSISQVNTHYLEQSQFVRVINSEGRDVHGSRHRGRFQVTAIASNGSENQTGTESPGACKTFEFFETLDIEGLARTAAERAHLMLLSEYCPSGNFPVIIDKGFGGVIFHEACGHGLESYNIERQASVFCDKLGSLIASPLVSAVDDGTLPSEWGSLEFDDEGTPTERTQLIETGVLKTYMCDRLGARHLGLKSTGSARRESYRYAPVSRMRNTFILPGSSTLDEMIAHTDLGLYAKSLGGGSVNTATGEFNFAVTEGYLIRHGRIEKPVRGAVLIGKGHEVLSQIDHVGNSLGLAQGMCGATSGWVPVNVGQPALRVSRMIVGGRA